MLCILNCDSQYIMIQPLAPQITRRRQHHGLTIVRSITNHAHLATDPIVRNHHPIPYITSPDPTPPPPPQLVQDLLTRHDRLHLHECTTALQPQYSR
jgi:hypothetical protein